MRIKAINAARDAVITIKVVIHKIPKIFKPTLLLQRKNGKTITILMAKSLVFQLNPVGGVNLLKDSKLSSFE